MRHESIAHYEPDVVVEDEPVPLVRSRTVTDGALTMQVMINGDWHRRTPDLATTACGAPIVSQFSPLRRESLTEPLCEVCFTDFERDKAAKHTEREQKGTR
jgi:hypothetical protein